MKSIKINVLLTFVAFFAMLIMTACGSGSGEYEDSESEEAAEEATASEMEEESPYSGETAIGVVAEVEDYAKWIEVYERESPPASRVGVFQSVDNPNQIVVFEFTKSHEEAKQRFASEELKKAMEESGVTSQPSFTYYDMKYLNSGENIGQYRVAISHEVSDFNTWKEAFDKDESRRTEAGLTLGGMATDPENPNMVYMIFNTDDLDGVKSMLENPDMKKVMEEAGVVSEPVVSFWTAPASE